MAKVKEQLAPSKVWNANHGTYLNGQAAIDGADMVAIEMERRWGSGRLRLLVDLELRQKFDRQRYLYLTAQQHGDQETLLRECQRMVAAWMALDRAAAAAGALEMSPLIWETTLADGTVAALVRDPGEVKHVIDHSHQMGRRMVVYTMEEIGRMLDNYQAVTKVKEVFPGSTVEVIRKSIEDPLNQIRHGKSLDAPFDDEIPNFG